MDYSGSIKKNHTSFHEDCNEDGPCWALDRLLRKSVFPTVRFLVSDIVVMRRSTRPRNFIFDRALGIYNSISAGKTRMNYVLRLILQGLQLLARPLE